MCVGGGGVFEYVCVGVSVSLNEWVWMFLVVYASGLSKCWPTGDVLRLIAIV